MRIGINLIGFVPGAMGGVETYIHNLLSYLQKIDVENSYVLICDREHEKEFSLVSPSFSFAPENYRDSSLKGRLRGVLRNRLGIDLLRSEIDRMKLDLIHCPFTVIHPCGLKTPIILTFCDMQQEYYPQFFSTADLEERRRIFRPSVSQAVHILAISEHVKRCLVEKYKAEPDKIDVAYLGCGAEYQVITDKEALAGITAKYHLEAPFMFYPAATWPHKNHLKLLHCLKIMKERGFDGRLVLTGISKQFHVELHRQIELLGLADDVKLLGYLPYDELPYLYNLAKLLVFPSLFEGFGIPLVEAMACGCPVVCANVTSIPEIVGSAGVMFDPDSAEDMAEKLARVWADDELRQSMRLKGFAQARLFTWEKTAEETLAAYRKAYAAL